MVHDALLGDGENRHDSAPDSRARQLRCPTPRAWTILSSIRSGVWVGSTQHELQEDGRYVIVLEGIVRFRIQREIEQIRGYRRVEADLTEFEIDLTARRAAD